MAPLWGLAAFPRWTLSRLYDRPRDPRQQCMNAEGFLERFHCAKQSRIFQNVQPSARTTSRSAPCTLDKTGSAPA